MQQLTTLGRLRHAPRPAVLGVMGLIALVGTGLGGCASNQELVDANRALTDRNQALVQENQSLRNANAALQAGLTSRDQALADYKRQVEELLGGRGDLLARLGEMDSKLAGMKFGQLDAETDQALRELAAQYPHLVEYDADLGMLRFKSDLTFASGSDDVTAAGRQTLQEVSRILNTSAAIGYDVRVVGHTDTQRVTQKPGRRFTNNVELSAFRAIAVRDVLVSGGVSAPRIEVAGRGEFMPLVPNAANGNTPANRRVELFLVRPIAPRASVGPAPTAEPAPAPARRPVDEEIMK